MEYTLSTNIKEGAAVRHSWINMAYWILVTIIFLYDRTYLITKAGLPNFLICSVVRISLLIALAWTNIHWLIPHYLLQKRYGSYFWLVFLLILGYLLLQSLYDTWQYGVVIGPTLHTRLSSSLVYNFTHTSLYLLLTVALKFSIDWYEQQRQLRETQVEKLQAEVNYLRSQVNPHFLFNTLNNLYALTIKKSDNAPHIVLKLSELMEYMLYDSDATYVPLEKEIKYLSNYLELEKIRQGNAADIRMTTEGNMDRCTVPPFLILPLVENAFKHGIGKVVHNAFLHIDIRTGDALEVRIVNSKSPVRSSGRSGGIGLFNLRKRLSLLYPGRHTLLIDDQPDKYEVTLKIDGTC